MKKRIFLSLLAIIIIAVAITWMSLESIVKSVVNKFGSEVTGTEVKLEGFNLSPFDGAASIRGLTVANPKNYKNPYLLSLNGISVKLDVKSLMSDTIVIEDITVDKPVITYLDVKSLMSDTIVIEDITVDKPVITYEMLSISQNNIKQLQSNISKNTASAEKAQTAKDEKGEKDNSASAKKVIIKKLTVKAGELKAAANVGGEENSIDVVLPEIVLTDIGGQDKGESIVASISKVLNKILSTASQTVVKSGLSDLKNVAKKNLDNVVGGVKDKVKSFGIFGN